jgi:hypothetical protein
VSNGDRAFLARPEPDDVDLVAGFAGVAFLAAGFCVAAALAAAFFGAAFLAVPAAFLAVASDAALEPPLLADDFLVVPDFFVPALLARATRCSSRTQRIRQATPCAGRRQREGGREPGDS